MHVNGIIFLVGASRHIGLIQCVCIRKKHREKFMEAILLVIREYQSQGIFDVISIGADKAFDSIKSILEDKLYQVALTTCDDNQYVEIIERTIGSVKERIQVVRLAMPYTTIPKRFMIKMVHRAITLMNSLPHKGGLYSVISPTQRKILA